MAQRRQLTWSELRVGLFVLLGIVVVAVAIFYVTGAGVLGPKYNLKTYLPEVQGLGSGAPVSLDGVEVGNVETVRLVPREPGKAPDKMHNIEITMRIQKKYQNDILTDSTASLVTEGLLGNRYVNVERGYMGRPLKEGEAIPGTSDVHVAVTHSGVTLAPILGRYVTQEVMTGSRAEALAPFRPERFTSHTMSARRVSNLVFS